MTKSNSKRDDDKAGSLLLKILTAHYNALVLARSDDNVLKQYSALLRFLRSQSHDFLNDHAPTKHHNEKSEFSPALFEQGLETASLDDLQSLVTNEQVSRKHLEQLAIERFSVPRGSMRSYSNRKMLVEKLRSLIDNERAHQIIGAVARGQTKDSDDAIAPRTPPDE